MAFKAFEKMVKAGKPSKKPASGKSYPRHAMAQGVGRMMKGHK